MPTMYPGHDVPHNWTDNAWSIGVDDGSGGWGPPVSGVDVVFTALSVPVSMDDNGACDSLDMSTVGADAGLGGPGVLDVAGDVVWGGLAGVTGLYCGGSFEAVAGHEGASSIGVFVMDGTGTLTSNGVALPGVIVNTGGTVTFARALAELESQAEKVRIA